MACFLNFLSDYRDTITLLLTLVNIFIGYMSYRTARSIYKKGIQLDKDNMLERLGLEFVISYIQQLDEFESAVKRYYDFTVYRNDNVKTVLDNLKNAKPPSVAFSYWEEHKGDIWTALDKKGSRFEYVRRFISKAKYLDSIIGQLQNDMEYFVEKGSGSKPVEECTMEDFCKSLNNKEVLNRLEPSINEVKQCITSLPNELHIEEIKREICA